MANFSNYAESGLLNWIFRANTNNFTRPPLIAIALCSGVPDESNWGGNIPELANAGGYARLQLGAPANGTWTEVDQNFSGSGHIDNVSQFAFTQASANWGHVSGVAILDSGVYGSGNMWMYGRLTTPREVLSGDTFVFNAGEFDLFLG